MELILPASPCIPYDSNDGGEGTHVATAPRAIAIDSVIGSCHATP